MDRKPLVEVIILHETWLQSAARDVTCAGMLLALVAVGIWFDSSTLQWMGGVTWVLWLSSRMLNHAKRKTPQQAAEHLAAKYGARA